jgi:NAD(P)H-hydrate repair Nnr-like enzyme with NAD(P)H-hydrate dehydratase domain
MALEKIDAIPKLAPRVRDGHKGRYGTVLVIAGGRGMAGAAALCGASSLRSGAGLVRVATSAEVQPVVASFDQCYMVYPLPNQGEGLIEFARSRPILAAISEGLIVVLKGSGTVVTDGKTYFINTTGNPGMATGGSGDVLTGVIAALIGQKLSAYESARLGVFVHGLAGDIARDHHGEVGMIAGDIVDALPDAFAHLMPDPDLSH